MFRKILLSEICKLTNLPFKGKDREINGLNLCNQQSSYSNIISYVTSIKFLDTFRNNNKITALLLPEELYESYAQIRADVSFLIVPNPEEKFYEIHETLIQKTKFYQNKTFSQNNNNFHSSVIIEDGVEIGENVKIGYHSVIKSGTIIGNNVEIGDNVVIGSEGFQILKINGLNKKIPHVGGVILEDNVFVAAGSTISKSLFDGYVKIGENTKIDSQVHIGHNCEIGSNSVLTGNVLLMGSVKIGNDVWLSPSSTILNKVNVNDSAHIGSCSFVTRNVKNKTTVLGIPAIEQENYFKLEKEKFKLLLK